MQTSAVNWLVIGLVLIALFLFGIVYAWMVRQMSKHGIEGQTAYLVIGGVLVTLLGAVAVVGWLAAALVLVCFMASGLPMVVEYVLRISEQHRADREKAVEMAKGLINE